MRANGAVVTVVVTVVVGDVTPQSTSVPLSYASIASFINVRSAEQLAEYRRPGLIVLNTCVLVHPTAGSRRLGVNWFNSRSTRLIRAASATHDA